ncbi:MAG: hypothetical protein U0R23_07470 [Candidatus Nanopelagicales bacterium]
MGRKLNLDVDLDPSVTQDEIGGHESTERDLLAERPPHHDRD